MCDMDAAACVVIALLTKSKKRKKRIWMKAWLKKRRDFTHERLLNELRISEPSDFKNFLRLDAETFDELLQLVEPYIKKADTSMRDAISVSQRLSITLRYLATGNSFEDLKFTSAISAQAIGRIVVETCNAIVHCLQNYIQIPKSEEEWTSTAQEFYKRWNFPNCLGAVDGKHIAIRKPPGSGSRYYNYKHFFSVVLFAVVNANYEFIMVDVGVNGRVSDGGVLGNTEFGKALSNKRLNLPQPDILPNSHNQLPYVFVGDEAFALTENFMKPFSQTGLTPVEAIFNYRLSRARRIVENAFGILASRFGVFQRPIMVNIANVNTIVLACCYLHNYLRRKSGISYISRGNVDTEILESGHIVNGSWRDVVQPVPLQPIRGRKAMNTAKAVRDAYCDYFNNEGEVSWQYNFI